MRTWSRTGLPLELEHRTKRIAMLSSHKLTRTTNKTQVLLPHVMHPHLPPDRFDDRG